MKNDVIKKYIWETEEGACERCQALNNTEYPTTENIPDRPHPNCKCNIREVYQAGCDCWDVFDEFEKALDDGDRARSEGENVLNSLLGYLSENLIEPARETIEELIAALEQVLGTFGDFISNWQKMKEINKETYHPGTPEYYHSKANCEATQRGKIGEATSEILGEIREFTDYYKDIYLKGQSAQQASYNNDYDFSQNKAGRVLGKKYPEESCDDILKYRRPKDLPKNSW